MRRASPPQLPMFPDASLHKDACKCMLSGLSSTWQECRNTIALPQNFQLVSHKQIQTLLTRHAFFSCPNIQLTQNRNPSLLVDSTPKFDSPKKTAVKAKHCIPLGSDRLRSKLVSGNRPDFTLPSCAINLYFMFSLLITHPVSPRKAS